MRSTLLRSARGLLRSARGLLRSARGLLALILLGPSFVACVQHATVAECGALLDRYVELLVREQDPKATEVELARQKALTREKAAHDSSFTSCPKELSSRSLRCALRAPNVDEFEKCLE